MQPIPEAKTTAPAATQRTAGGTILFVDDESNILNSLNRLFRPLGYRVLTAPGGAQGLALLDKEAVDIVVSDMRMPEMDGAAFLEQVASRWPGITRILLTGYADISSTVAAINKGHIYRYIAKPWEDNDLRLTIQHAMEQRHLERERERLEALTRKQNEELKEFNANLEAKVAARTEELRQTMGFLEVAHGNLKKSYAAAVKVFGSLIEMREGSGAGHCRRVAEHARRLAAAVGMTDGDTQQVMFAGLLHDIGKIGLPDTLLHKPFNVLSAEERTQVARHPAVGQAVLMALEPLQEAAKLIRSHHERYDGQGYPDGLRGEAVPLGARILAVVNDYDALQLGTLVPERLGAAQARQFLSDNRGKRYDPRVVDTFLGLIGKDETQAAGASDVCVKSAGLKPGMVLARDLVTRDGILLLSRDYILDEGLIRKLHALERTNGWDLSIYVLPNRRG